MWDVRQEICSGKGGGEFAVAKLAILPAELGEALETIARLCRGELRWSVVVQATGIGWVRLKGAAAGVDSVLRQLRSDLEGRGGSLVLAQRTASASAFEAWGSAGDALPLMSAVKRQFDPMGTLNPGRFVGGI